MEKNTLQPEACFLEASWFTLSIGRRHVANFAFWPAPVLRGSCRRLPQRPAALAVHGLVDTVALLLGVRLRVLALRPRPV